MPIYSIVVQLYVLSFIALLGYNNTHITDIDDAEDVEDIEDTDNIVNEDNNTHSPRFTNSSPDV